jgi:chromate transporter
MLKTLIDLMVSFGKIGFIALGGGHSMLKLIEYETVIHRHWMLKDDFITIVGTTFLFPGLTAVKLSAIIGYKTAGLLGLIVAVICLNLPGLLLALIGYRFLTHSDSHVAKKLIVSVQYGALALLAAASFSIAQGVIKNHYSIALMLLCSLFFFCLTFFEISPFWGLFAFIGIAFFFVT